MIAKKKLCLRILAIVLFVVGLIVVIAGPITLTIIAIVDFARQYQTITTGALVRDVLLVAGRDIIALVVAIVLFAAGAFAWIAATNHD
jgi:hypothetical protein